MLIRTPTGELYIQGNIDIEVIKVAVFLRLFGPTVPLTNCVVGVN